MGRGVGRPCRGSVAQGRKEPGVPESTSLSISLHIIWQLGMVENPSGKRQGARWSPAEEARLMG